MALRNYNDLYILISLILKGAKYQHFSFVDKKIIEFHVF